MKAHIWGSPSSLSTLPLEPKNSSYMHYSTDCFTFSKLFFKYIEGVSHPIHSGVIQYTVGNYYKSSEYLIV